MQFQLSIELQAIKDSINQTIKLEIWCLVRLV